MNPSRLHLVRLALTLIIVLCAAAIGYLELAGVVGRITEALAT